MLIVLCYYAEYTIQCRIKFRNYCFFHTGPTKVFTTDKNGNFGETTELFFKEKKNSACGSHHEFAKNKARHESLNS